MARRPDAVAAGALLSVEALASALGAHSLALAVLPLLLAPGLALSGLLPPSVRAQRAAALAAAPILGAAASSVALITLTRIGIPLTGVSVRLTALALVAAGALLGGDGSDRRRGAGVLEAAGLASALALAVLLERRVIGGSPVPGNDWAKYALYADEIRRQGALLIDNPYWMLGVPFREDPGAPSLLGAGLVLSDAPAAAVAHAIWAFAILQVLGLFAWARAAWGAIAGVAAAALAAVLPMTQDILGWHGLANLAALGLLALLLAYATDAVGARLTARATAGFALVLVALAAAHRLSALVGVGALGLTLVAAGLTGARHVWAQAARVALAAAVLGAGVIADVVARQRTFGGTLPARFYADTKVDLGLTARDLSYAFVAAAGAALVVALTRSRERTLWPALSLLAVIAALAYSWLVHLPLSYLRMVYFLPVALVPLVAFGLSRLPGRAAVAATAALTALIAVTAFNQAVQLRRFYQFASPASLRGLDAVAATLHPREVVVTDRCWSFLATWLLHTRTLPALSPEDIQPRAELPFARRAQAVLDGTPAGRRTARRLGVRYLIVDPLCVSAEGVPLDPPVDGDPVYVSERLVVLRLPRRG